jgi:transcriptional regulator with XRE-family HTH domain
MTKELAAQAASNEVVHVVGERLRELRKRRKMSLVELAAASGRSIGYLSQIERGISSPTIREVAMLADVLGAGFLDLLTPTAGRPPAAPIRKHDDRAFLPFRGARITKRILSPRNEGALKLFIMELEPGAPTGQNPYSHEGEEAGYVLEGSIEIQIGDEVFALVAGDSFRFSSRLPHAFRALAERAASVLWVNVGDR